MYLYFEEIDITTIIPCLSSLSLFSRSLQPTNSLQGRNWNWRGLKNTYFFWYSIYLYTLIVTFGQGFPRDMIEPQWEKHDAAPLHSFQGLHRSSLHGGPWSLARQGSVSLAIDVIFKVMWKLSTNFLLPKKNTIKWWVLDVMTVDCLFLCFIVHSKRK